MARRGKRGRPVHGILLLDKPAGASSNQVLQRVRRLFDAQKAGHTGTLDPLATGMLPICFGEATKLGHYLLSNEKGYETTLQLGVSTDSGDADGAVVDQRALPEGLDRSAVEAVCARFTGAQHQVPPMVSALKHQGKRLYELAREGVEVERAPRNVTIHALEVLGFDGEQARLSVRCSKGTYIRSLAADIGEALGCGAHVLALRRTFVAPFAGQPMVTLEALEGQLAATMSGPSALDANLLPMSAALPDIGMICLDATGQRAFGHGRAVSAVPGSTEPESTEPESTGPVIDRKADPERTRLRRVYGPSGQLLGLGRAMDGGTVEPLRVFQYS